MKRSIIRKLLIFAIILLPVLMVRGCWNTFNNTGQEIFTSPEGSSTIIVQYDFVCRPTIYKKGVFWKRKIWDYPENGFMETVRFDVEWLSEKEFRFSYDDVDDEFDEEYIVTIPD